MRLRELGLALVLGIPSTVALAADRVGSESCASCHPAAFEIWKAGPHGRAAAGLSPAQRNDIRCQTCHSPDLARETQEASAFHSPDRLAARAQPGVSCESCHGAGQYYAPSYVMRDQELSHAVGLVDPGQKSCVACHTNDAPSLSPFDFAAKVKLIDHWSQDHKRAPAPRRKTSEAEHDPSPVADRNP